MKKPPFRIVFSMFMLLVITGVHAQSNYQWKPVGADTTYPRTIIDSWEIPDLKVSLAAGQNITLYQDIYNSANSNPPVGNSTLVERATRAAIAKNAAYVLMLGVKPNGSTTANLLPAEKTTLKNKAINLIEQLNTYIYPITNDSPINYNAWHHYAKDLIMSVEAYDFLMAAGATSGEMLNARIKLRDMTGEFYSNATQGGSGFNFFQTNKDNQTLLTASAIGLSAVVLNDLTDTVDKFRPINWINCAMWNIHNILWWDIRRIADPRKVTGFSEGPHFFRYGFTGVLPFIFSMGNFTKDTIVYYEFAEINRKIRNPWYDTAYQNLWKWYAAMRMPDGSMPPIEDSYRNHHFPELAILRNQRYYWPMHLSQLDSLQENTANKQMTSIYDMRADILSANLLPQTPTDSSFIAYPDAGVAVFRSGNDSASTYFALLGKNGNILTTSEYHNQADDASFIMMVNGQHMAMDPGYVYAMTLDSAVTAPEFLLNRFLFRDSVAKAENHNVILVDNQGTDYGYPSKSNGSECFIEKYFKSPVQNYAEIRTNYLQTDITRKVMHVRNKYFLLVDHMSSASPHQYSMLLHGYGTIGLDSFTNGKFFDLTANKRAAWRRNKSGLYAYFDSDKQFTINKKNGRHEHTYYIMQPHIYTSCTNNTPITQMSYMTCLQPFRTLQTDTMPIITLDVDFALGYKIVDGANLDIAVTKSFNNSISIAKTTTGLSNNYATDGRFFFANENGGQVKDLFVYQATFMNRDADSLFTSTKPYNLEYISGNKLISGYSGDTGYVRFHTKEYPYEVTGEGVWGTSYDAASQVITVRFGKPTAYTIKMDNTHIGMSEALPEAQFVLYPNPAQDELNVAFESFIPETSRIHLFDISGKEVMQRSSGMKSKVVSFNISSLESGIYFVTVTLPDGTQSAARKLMVTR